jgi:alpha-L-fucosidase
MIPWFHDERDVFFTRRFGMFVHWGLYALPAWHEQILWRGKMKRAEYAALARAFDPTRFDPDGWIDLAEEAGMGYVCFTAKHHDGFCMWDTEQTEYNVKQTPYGKDVLAMLAEACARRGFPLSVYYSCADWHHPNYPNAGLHHEMFGPAPGDKPDIARYYEYVRAQVTELCTRYGKLYQFFWDGNTNGYRDPSINLLIRSLQPGILINDRGPDGGDYGTPERSLPEGRQFDRPTEACQSLGRESWGFKTDEDYYSLKHLMRGIDRALAMGGNFLLNVGPRADGTIADRNADTLRRLGRWYAAVKEAFEGAEPAPFVMDKDIVSITGGNGTVRDEVLATKRGYALYIHLCDDPQSSAVLLPPLDILPRRAVLLNDGRELEARVDVTPWHWKEKPILRIRGIPADGMAGAVMVIRLDFDPNDMN